MPKSDENGEWRRLHNEEIRNLYSLPKIISRRLRWADYVVRIQEGRNALKVLTGKLAIKRQLGRPRNR